MALKKTGNKWCVVHCEGARKGQPIKCYKFNPQIRGDEAVAKRRATAMHKAIESKKRRKKI